MAQAEIERVSYGKRDKVARKVDDDGTIAFVRESLIPVKPGVSGRRVATAPIIDVRANRFNCNDASQKPGAGANVVPPHNDGGA